MRQIPAHPNIPWFRAVGTMVGSVIGVGVFGIPYAFARSGYLLGLLELLVVGGLLLALQLMYAEVAVQTPGRYRIAGYVKHYLGSPWGGIATVLFMAYTWGAMVAYVILGGEFLFTLLGPVLGGSVVWYHLGLVVLVGLLTFRGNSQLSKAETPIVAVLLFLFAFMSLAALPYVDLGNLARVSTPHWFVPYGVIVFALSGLGVVPEMKDILGKQASRLPHALVVGQAIIIFLYATFAFAVVGATGIFTTEKAFDGLVPLLGRTFAIAGAVLGSLTVASIFSQLTIQLQSTFRFDYGIGLRKAWLLTLAVPTAAFLLGAREFIHLIGFLGAVLGGCVGILLILTYERLQRSPVCRTRTCLDVPNVVSWGLVAVFLGGMVYALFDLFS